MRVIVTRPTQEASQWVHALNDAGFDAVALPLIGVLPPSDPAAVAAVWARIGEFDAVMFVSGNVWTTSLRQNRLQPKFLLCQALSIQEHSLQGPAVFRL